MQSSIKEIFRCKNDAEYAIFLEDHLEAYRREGGELSAPDTDAAYLRVLMHYLFRMRPAAEHNIESVLKLMGASYKEKGYRTPFWAIIREAAIKAPEDEIFYNARRLEQELANEDIDELFDFMEYELHKDGDGEEALSELGLLAVCRVRYQQNRARNIRMPERKKEKNRNTSSAFHTACERFVREYTPRRIKEYLDRFVLGQEESKVLLSTAVYNHFLRILHPEEHLLKTNVLMIGPSGCGKTELIRRISELVPVPVVITDFSGVVATPWKGRNKEEALLNLYLKAGKDQELTECGIVFCDEFDKIIPSKLYSKGGDINQELQGQLLGMFEGTDMDVPLGDKSGGQECILLNTDNILFVCAGAFEGLDKIVKKDYLKSGIGFGSDVGADENFEMTGVHLKTEHLIEYGMKPELAGRLSAVTVLKALDREMLKRVLTEPEDSILSRYETELKLEDGVRLNVTDAALDVIIDRVMEMSIGARGLNAVVRDILADVLYEVPSMPQLREVMITEAAARREEKAVYI
ncbi:MAG: AAA family ATPase [Lachnospiraceae bacterium]|nr:AAA family ATPase [Lachnospiraceae bacterium]